MRIVWFSWKDIKHPQAGGAETISHEIMQRLVRDGHEVKLVTSRYTGSVATNTIDGISVTRLGSRYSVYLKSWIYFKKHLKSWPDLVVDEMNTLPFATSFYTRKKVVLFVHQLARKVWFYQTNLLTALVGYPMEPVYLFILSRRRTPVITVSDSTSQDLMRYGFKQGDIHLIREGIELRANKLPAERSGVVQILCLGSIRPMKRTLDAVKAFEVAKTQIPSLRMVIAGDDSGHYAQKVKRYCQASPYMADIDIVGRVSNSQRVTLMRTAKIILVTSVKEGWGLIVTEANSQGTPAVAYDVDGLRDSVQKNKTGILVKSGDTTALGEQLASVLQDGSRYTQLRKEAFIYSREFTFENSYQDFVRAAKIKK